ncbi:MAG: rubredoxin [Bacteroidales bacterium]
MYKCKVCGYVYDPLNGDPTQGIPPNTSFDQLPADWKCPICDASIDEFIEI